MLCREAAHLKRLHELLAKPPYSLQIPWAQLHIFWGDERYVPIDDEQNNAGMAYDTLLGHVYTPEEQIHVWRTDLNQMPLPLTTIGFYTIISAIPALRSIWFCSAWATTGIHFSLFPGTEVVHEQSAWTKAYFLQQQGMFRLTLTAPLVNRSACVLFLVAGPKKAEPLREVLEGTYNPDKYPSQVIKPVNGDLIWLVDEKAAADLKKID